MKISRLIIFGFLFLASCTNERDTNVSDADTLSLSEAPSVTLKTPPYNVEFDEQTQKINLSRSAESVEGATASDVLKSLNDKYKDIELRLLGHQHDTVALNIDNARKLTQGMGTTGAEAYLAELTFSLTELPGIKFVKIDFEEGDHAMPGVYSRDDFKDLIK